jgi:hypothetical protein
MSTSSERESPWPPISAADVVKVFGAAGAVGAFGQVAGPIISDLVPCLTHYIGKYIYMTSAFGTGIAAYAPKLVLNALYTFYLGILGESRVGATVLTCCTAMEFFRRIIAAVRAYCESESGAEQCGLLVKSLKTWDAPSKTSQKIVDQITKKLTSVIKDPTVMYVESFNALKGDLEGIHTFLQEMHDEDDPTMRFQTLELNLLVGVIQLYNQMKMAALWIAPPANRAMHEPDLLRQFQAFDINLDEKEVASYTSAIEEFQTICQSTGLNSTECAELMIKYNYEHRGKKVSDFVIWYNNTYAPTLLRTRSRDVGIAVEIGLGPAIADESGQGSKKKLNKRKKTKRKKQLK